MPIPFGGPMLFPAGDTGGVNATLLFLRNLGIGLDAGKLKPHIGVGLPKKNLTGALLFARDERLKRLAAETLLLLVEEPNPGTGEENGVEPEDLEVIIRQAPDDCADLKDQAWERLASWAIVPRSLFERLVKYAPDPWKTKAKEVLEDMDAEADSAH